MLTLQLLVARLIIKGFNLILMSAMHVMHYGEYGSAGADEPADPTAGMSAREKKMHELQQRLRQSRKANENAVIAEKRRQQVASAGIACLARTAAASRLTVALRTGSADHQALLTVFKASSAWQFGQYHVASALLQLPLLVHSF